MVERTTLDLPVDGVPRRFTAYVCSRLGVAIGRVDGAWVSVNAPAPLLSRLELAREKPAELKRFLERMDAMKAAREAKRRDAPATGRAD